MPLKNRKSIVDRLVRVATAAKEPYPGAGKGVGFALEDPEHRTIQEVISELFQPNKGGWSRKYSKSYIDRSINAILHRAVQNEDAGARRTEIEELVQKLESEYESFAYETTIFVPLDGVILKIPSVDIGNVRLLQKNSIDTDALASRIPYVTDPEREEELRQLGKDSTPAMPEQMLQINTDVVKRTLIYPTYSEYTTQADNTRSRELAIEETRLAIDVLRYLCARMDSGRHYLISLVGEEQVNIRRSLVISTQAGASGRHHEVVRSRFSLEIDEGILGDLRDFGLSQLSDILKRRLSGSTEIERVLIRSIHWLSEAIAQDDLDHKVLDLVTALEAILNPQDRGELGRTIAEGAAILVGSSMDGKKQIRDWVSRLYTTRSHITHGSSEEVTGDDIDFLTFVCAELIGRVLNMASKFKKKADLERWLSDQKLATPQEPAIDTAEKNTDSTVLGGEIGSN